MSKVRVTWSEIESGIPLLTGTAYTVVVPRKEILKLRIRLLSLIDEPLAGVPCTLTVGGAETQVETDADGVVEACVPAEARSATLLVDGQLFDLVLGDLPPIDSPEGLHARLRNLGYAYSDDDADPDDLRFALALFQNNRSLPVTGEADEQTKAAITESAGG